MEQSPSMNQENKVERGSERIPTKEEIFELVGLEMGECEILNEKYDDAGLYCLEIRLGDVGYDYMRKGDRGRGESPLDTGIDKVFYDGGEVEYAENFARYNSETGEWTKFE